MYKILGSYFFYFFLSVISECYLNLFCFQRTISTIDQRDRNSEKSYCI